MSGFVPSRILLMLTMLPFFPFAKAAAAPEAVCVTATRAVLYKEASTMSPVTFTAGLHTPLIRIEQKGRWSRVRDFQNQYHWIASNAINRPGRRPCTIVKTDYTLLYASADGDQLSPLMRADRYAAFATVDIAGDRVLVQDDHAGEYWVSRADLWSPAAKTKVKFTEPHAARSSRQGAGSKSY